MTNEMTECGGTCMRASNNLRNHENSPTGGTFLVMLAEYRQTNRTDVAHVNRLFVAEAAVSFTDFLSQHTIKSFC